MPLATQGGRCEGNQRKDINPDESGSFSGRNPCILAGQVFASLVAHGEQAFIVEMFNHFASVIFLSPGNLPSHNNYLYSDSSKMSLGLIAAELNLHFLMSASLSSFTWADSRTVPVFAFHYTQWAD